MKNTETDHLKGAYTMSTTKATLLKTIHQKCMDCSAYQIKEIELCPSNDCPLWPFRMGKDSFKTGREISDAQRENLAKARAARKTIAKDNENQHDRPG